MPEVYVPTAREREQLAVWLHARELDLKLRGNTDEPAVQTPADPPQAVPVATGQVRLLPPYTPSLPETEHPVFVLVLAGNTKQTSTIVPFSRFDIPATPGEWSTEFEQKPLKVLCFWNSRLIPASDLEHSWLTHTLSDEQIKAITNACGQYPFPPTPRHGPALLHPLDPRHSYLHEEQTLLDDALRAMHRPETNGNTLLYPVDKKDMLQKAAEDGSDYLNDKV